MNIFSVHQNNLSLLLWHHFQSLTRHIHLERRPGKCIYSTSCTLHFNSHSINHPIIIFLPAYWTIRQTIRLKLSNHFTKTIMTSFTTIFAFLGMSRQSPPTTTSFLNYYYEKHSPFFSLLPSHLSICIFSFCA